MGPFRTPHSIFVLILAFVITYVTIKTISVLSYNHFKSVCFLERASTRSGTILHYLLGSCYVAAWLRTWHVAWGLLILTVTTLLSLWALDLAKMKIKYFWFVTCPLDRCFTWLCGWGLFILIHHPAKFGVHRPCESGDITSLICHVTT